MTGGHGQGAVEACGACQHLQLRQMLARRAQPPTLVLEQRQLTDTPPYPSHTRPTARRCSAAASWRPVAAVGTDSATAYRSNVSAFPPPVVVADASADGTAGTPGRVGVAQPGPGDQPGRNVAPALVPHRPDPGRHTAPVRSRGTSHRPLLTRPARTVDNSGR
ncbi:hypothetical protein ACFYM3_41685 [Streptomyces massasporeus]|uniref:Uncharacterized protein n=1 Tax=Streptomyces massasporeus TaxID=67324 RepID=A0ABW6LTR7_9ACTN